MGDFRAMATLLSSYSLKHQRHVKEDLCMLYDYSLLHRSDAPQV